VHIQADRSTHPSHQCHPSTSTNVVDSERENQPNNDTDRYKLKAQPRQVAGAADRKARARSPSRKTAYPSALSQEGPCPGSTQPTIRTGRTLREAVSCREGGYLSNSGWTGSTLASARRPESACDAF
jgi:hypothetical protein